MSYVVRTGVGTVEVPDAPKPVSAPPAPPCIRLCPTAQPWDFLDKLGTIATAITAGGIVWSILRSKR